MSRMDSDQSSPIEREARQLLDRFMDGRLDRRSLIRRAAGLGLSAAAIDRARGRPLRRSRLRWRVASDRPGSGTKGGTLRVATIGEPPHLDEHQSTAEIIAIIGFCAYEGLFTYDASYQPIPELSKPTPRAKTGSRTRWCCARASSSTTAKN